MSKKYYLYVHNTMTGKTEKVEVTEEVYFVYRRTEWNIKDNNNSFYKHEIQLSSLIGYYENFSEFIIQDDLSEHIANKIIIEKIIDYLNECSLLERKIFYLSFVEEMTERKISKILKISKTSIHNIKQNLIIKIKKYLKY